MANTPNHMSDTGINRLWEFEQRELERAHRERLAKMTAAERGELAEYERRRASELDAGRD